MPGDANDADRLLSAIESCTSAEAALAAGVVANDAIQVACARAKADDRFEIGSITKTLTAQVLASLVVDGTVVLDAPIGTWLDAGPNGGITLEQLATHTSGLPRLAPNAFRSLRFRPRNPYAHYSADMAEKGLRRAKRSDNTESAYSNFGYQILGLALERAAGVPLTTLLSERVFLPFGLAGMSVGPHPSQVQGTMRGRPTRAWTMQLAGPGGVVGTISDLLAWCRAVLDPPAGGHGEALRLALEPRAPDQLGAVGLAWHHTDGVIWHNGGTGGFHGCIAIDPVSRRAAASLAAVGGVVDGQDEATLRSARPAI